MKTITIAYEVSEDKFETVELPIESINGEGFIVGRGDFTSIDNNDAEYVSLLVKINRIINDEE